MNDGNKTLQPQLLMRYPWLNEPRPILKLPEGYQLRTYAAGDASKLAALMSHAFEESWDEDRVHKVFVEPEDVKETFVIVHEGMIIATTSARIAPESFPGSGLVHYVGVDANHRGKKLALVLILHTLQYFQEVGMQDAMLETDDWRLDALRLYLRLGFVPEYQHANHQPRWSRLLRKLVR